jgi:hypothetical protein
MHALFRVSLLSCASLSCLAVDAVDLIEEAQCRVKLSVVVSEALNMRVAITENYRMSKLIA